MFSLGPLSFAQPWALAALILLPALWRLLRLTPPPPLTARFPPVRLLGMAQQQDAVPTRTPLWLLLLRLLLVITVIFAAAGPLLDASNTLRGQGPLTIIIDDGWAAAADWRGRSAVLSSLVDQAERQDKPIIIVTTAPAGQNGPPPPLMLRAAEAGKALAALQPKPWPTDRKAALAPLFNRDSPQPGHVAWLSDGMEEGGVEDLAVRLQDLGAMTLFADPPAKAPSILLEPRAEGSTLIITAVRPGDETAASRRLRAVADDGHLLGSVEFTFAPQSRRGEARLDLPTEMRNRLARLEIEGETTAAAVMLIDERWRRRPVGLVSTEEPGSGQPLLSSLYYLERALDPFAEIRRGSLAELLKRELSVIVLTDPERLEEGDRKSLAGWIAAGGVAVRFAGAGTADRQDDMLPVQLRQGDRAVGGAMSWSKPAALASFTKDSPFFGLDIPADVRVRRQVLALPLPDLAAKTWARLEDGTPLVTAEKRGLGRLILVHTTATPAWSNLPLSGLFVHMLRRIVDLSRGVETKPGGPPLTPQQTLDGFGRLQMKPTAAALPIPSGDFDKTVAGPDHPPGFYGDETARRALNLAGRLPDPRPFRTPGITPLAYDMPGTTDLKPGLLGLALALMVGDLAAGLFLRGLLRAAAGGALTLTIVATAWEAGAAVAEEKALAATLTTRLAYVITGDEAIDRTSRAGLSGLSVMVNRRTASDLGEPLGVDPRSDELSFFPLIYWPTTPLSQPLSPDAAANLNAYLQNGGVILFDTRDAGGNLRELTAKLNIPPLEPITLNHVLSRTFYLLREFPGRWSGGAVWVERSGERVNDGVSPIIAGSNDWAAAWAMDDAQRPLYAVTPGGEVQREAAYRFGVNLVMYALTGNYKADQIHMPTILERLGK